MLQKVMLPTYKELIKHSRKQQRHRKWRKFLHRLGIHTWKTYWRGACKVWQSGLFISAHKVEGEAGLQHCLFCTAERGIISNGIQYKEFDADYMKRRMAYEGYQIRP
jgi:hypothetical protein